MSGSVDVAAQWANDPLGRFEVRYWDGSQWTEHVANGGVAALDPLDVAVPAAGVVASDGVSSEVAAVVPVDTAWAAQDDAAAVPVDTAWAAQDDAAVVPVVADARSGAMLAPAQWAPDPLRRHELRYWDGVAWTDHVWGAGVQAVDPVSVAPTVPISPMTPASADAAPGLVAAPTSVPQGGVPLPTEPASPTPESAKRRRVWPFVLVVAVIGAMAVLYLRAGSNDPGTSSPAGATSATTPVTIPQGGANPASTLAASVFYKSCASVKAAGAAPLEKGSPGYRAELDPDGDGVACNA